MKKGNSQFLSMALSYLEIGRIAADADTEFRDVGDYQNAVAYQAFHAVELFYKYMLSKVLDKVPQGHDLEELEEVYRQYYLDDNYKLNHPFSVKEAVIDEANPAEQQLKDRHLEQFKPRFLDQHLRYPLDERTGGYSFCFSSDLFEALREEMLRISILTK